MRFRLFSVDVEIQMSFWVTSVLLALPTLSSSSAPRSVVASVVAIWVAVVLLSVLVHEYGHAFAMKRHGIEPAITLYAMGGLTFNRSRVPLSRLDHVIVSLAGPFAGFALGGLSYALQRLWPHGVAGRSPLAEVFLHDMLWVNLGWGLINLLPVLPFDGGHVLDHALGPKRTQLTAAISTVAALLAAAAFMFLPPYFNYQRMPFGALLFGFSAIQSYRRFTADPATAAPPPPPELLPPELAALLRSARHALGEGDLDRAASLAQRVLEGDGGALPAPPAARGEALEVIAWTHLLTGHADDAGAVLTEARRAGHDPDVALAGAVLFARGDLSRARKVLEEARAKGDDRKEIIGPLVQILIAQGEVGRAAEVALAVVDTLSDDDARRMAGLAFEHEAFTTAARLYEAIFNRLRQPEDAYEAARAEAQGGRPERALDLLRRAVEAGFSDRARVWSDAALATLRAIPALEAVLPRP
jgi:Zn-dependent protease